VVATRPIANNGLLLLLENVKRKLEKAESIFRLVLDTQPIYREWLRLVEKYTVLGISSHDARIVAAMNVHGLTHLLTFNVQDFKRYHGKEISIVSPDEFLRSTPETI
jgi:predicted nucleic acid-binding protein